MKYLIILIWVELIILFAVGCNTPRANRGDWMENLSGKTYEPIDWWTRRSPWYRNVRTTEEINADWHRTYKETMEYYNKRIQELEDTNH